MRSISCLYIGSPKSLFSISDPSEFILTSIALSHDGSIAQLAHPYVGLGELPEKAVIGGQGA